MEEINHNMSTGDSFMSAEVPQRWTDMALAFAHYNGKKPTKTRGKISAKLSIDQKYYILNESKFKAVDSAGTR